MQRLRAFGLVVSVLSVAGYAAGVYHFRRREWL